MTVVDNSLQELASLVTWGYSGISRSLVLIRCSDGRLHHSIL